MTPGSCRIYSDVLAGKLSLESQELLLDMLNDKLQGEEVSLPSPSTFLKAKRDNLLRTCYARLNRPPIPEFYATLMRCKRLRAGSQYDEAILLLGSVHALSDKYSMPLPGQRQIANILKS